MHRGSPLFVWLGAALVTLGCSAARSRSLDATAGADGPDADAADSAPDAAEDGEADAADAPPKPPPVASAGSRLVVAGAAALVGQGLDSCTNDVAASGDRWCAFARPAGDPGFNELWVLDATKAVSGAAIRCDGTDASCLRVSTHLFESAMNGFTDSGFNGDTLVYGETPYPGNTNDTFLGVLFAWRPGWAAARALTSENGLSCVGQAGSDAALCFETREGDGLNTDLTVELHAGHLASAAGPVLPKLDTLLLSAPADAVGAPPRFGFALSPDGAYAAWSTRKTASDVETLAAQKLDADDTSRLAVASDVSQWALSPDGAAWYWLSGYNYDVTGSPSGTLQAATFPTGAGATTLATAVADFAAVGDKGLRFRADVAAQVGTLQWLADRAAPAAVATIDTGVLAVLDQSRDGGRILYAKTFTPARGAAGTPVGFDLVDLHVGSVAGGAPCVVSATPAARHAALAPSGELVLWDRIDAVTGDAQGLVTPLPSCAPTPFATRLRSVLPAGDGAYAYLDDADDTDAEATLRYAHVMNGALAAATQVQTRAASVFAPLQPALPAIAYTVATGTAADGLYVYVDTTPSADAGAPTPSDGGAAE